MCNTYRVTRYDATKLLRMMRRDAAELTEIMQRDARLKKLGKLCQSVEKRDARCDIFGRFDAAALFAATVRYAI